MAAGLLGGGSRFLGVDRGQPAGSSPTALAAQRERPASRPRRPTPAGTTLAREAVRARRAQAAVRPRARPPVHKNGDPRTPVLIGIAAEEGLLGPHLRLFQAVGRVHPELLGRTLPLNGAGVCGAACATSASPPDILRGFALLARAAGLVGHIAEEMRRPVGPHLRRGRPDDDYPPPTP